MQSIKPRYTVPVLIVAIILALALISLPTLNAASTAVAQDTISLQGPTLDPAQAAASTIAAVHTQTATASTPMPSPNVQGTIDALVTALLATEQTATAAALSGFTPVARNADWTPQFQSFNGFEMALVPIGCFMMGNQDNEAEKPVHPQCFDQPYWIDRYEVTNAQYGSSGNFSGANRPRESVNWFEARDFCVGRGARLPTEREWEYAARGPDNVVYPWGNEFVADNVVYSGNSTNQTADVGSHPTGDSLVGASDLSGNVWEWVSTIFNQERFPYPYRSDDGREENTNSTDVLRVLRGGSINYTAFFLRAANRSRDYPSFVNGAFGFRCARAYE